MKKIGTLTFADAACLDGVRLAIDVEEDPIGAAVKLLANIGLEDGNLLWISGTVSQIGEFPVILMSSVRRTTMAAAKLDGNEVEGEVQMECKEPGCGYQNELPYVIINKPPICQNPNPPKHKIKFF